MFYVYLPGRGRVAKQPRRAIDEDVMQSLSRLEGIVRRLQTRGLPDNCTSSPIEGSTPLPSKETTSPDARSGRSSNGSDAATLDQHLGKLVIDETRSYYVSNVL